MVVLLWDASALAKRYAPEVGSDTVDVLFDVVQPSRMVSSSVDSALLTLFQSYIETFAPDSGMTFLLVASDEHLVRTAQAEGIRAINPETLPAAGVPDFLAFL